MSQYLAKFQAWAHWLSGALLAAATLYATNDEVHQAVNNALSHNKKLAGFAVAVAPIVTAYLNSRKGQ